jgi:outer membrane lipoprotein-sorting protein
MILVSRSIPALAVLGLTLPASALDEKRAQELLRRTMLRTPTHNVTAVILQRMVDEPGRVQKIQVVLSRDGQSRHTVLSPLSLQGLDSLDDGKTTRTYLPDRKIVIEMKSPRTIECDAENRLVLAARNYRLRTEKGPTIAGRESALVVAQPRHRELAERRYYIDPVTGYLLKLETASEGKITTTFETRFVEYPQNLPRTAFRLGTLSGNVKVVAQTPANLGDPKDAAVRVGFHVIVPNRLPLGFTIEDVEVVNPERGKMVGVRITDGLVKGTVYQWSAQDERKTVAPLQGASMIEVGAVRIMLIVDVPNAARERLLASFRDAARKTALQSP